MFVITREFLPTFRVSLKISWEPGSLAPGEYPTLILTTLVTSDNPGDYYSDYSCDYPDYPGDYPDYPGGYLDYPGDYTYSPGHYLDHPTTHRMFLS